jgi:HSP20 family molecular chaperone IbpA
MRRCAEVLLATRRRAYDLFEERGGGHGNDVEDWIRAEREILFPATVTVARTPGRYSIEISIEGYKQKDLQAYTVGDLLIVKGDVATSNAGEDSGVEEKSLFVQWPLPETAVRDRIKAAVSKDTLTITIPVTEQTEQGEASQTATATA